MKRCTNELIAQGHITPRSCELCGIGPCQFYGNRVGDTGPVLALAYATQKDMKSQQQLDSNFQPKKDEAMKDMDINATFTRSLIPADPNTKGMRVKCDKCGIDASCLTCNSHKDAESLSTGMHATTIRRHLRHAWGCADLLRKLGKKEEADLLENTADQLAALLK